MRRLPSLPKWFQRVVLRRVGLSCVVMGLGFFVFGAGTLNLSFLLRAHTALVYEHGDLPQGSDSTES